MIYFLVERYRNSIYLIVIFWQDRLVTVIVITVCLRSKWKDTQRKVLKIFLSNYSYRTTLKSRYFPESCMDLSSEVKYPHLWIHSTSPAPVINIILSIYKKETKKRSVKIFHLVDELCRPQKNGYHQQAITKPNYLYLCNNGIY